MKQPVMTMTEAMQLADVSRGMGMSVGICDYCHVVRPSAEMKFHEDRHEVCVLVTCKDCESDNVLSTLDDNCEDCGKHLDSNYNLTKCGDCLDFVHC